MNEKIQIGVKDSTAYPRTLTQLVKTPDGGDAEYRYKYEPQVDAWRQTRYKTTSTSWFGTDFGNVVNLLHFSDLHSDAVNLALIGKFKRSLPFPIDVLFTGDMVKTDWGDGIAFWETDQEAENYMVVIGNHDSYSGGNWYAKTAAECYGRYISPFVANWGVVSQVDVCYYYKDWEDVGVRLIVLDVMHWDSTQASWLVSTLASAKAAGYHTIVSGHCSPANSDGGIKDCSFDTLGANVTHWESESYGKMNAAVPAAVQDFIDGGGHFVCYLTGHTHADIFRHPSSYPDQLYVAVANAGNNSHTSTSSACQLERVDGQKSQELYNLVTVNPIRQLLTIVRVGADHDTIGRHIGTVVFDYANNEIIWND